MPGQTRKQTGVPGQEAGRFIRVSIPREAKRRSEKSQEGKLKGMGSNMHDQSGGQGDAGRKD